MIHHQQLPSNMATVEITFADIYQRLLTYVALTCNLIGLSLSEKMSLNSCLKVICHVSKFQSVCQTFVLERNFSSSAQVKTQQMKKYKCFCLLGKRNQSHFRPVAHYLPVLRSRSTFMERNSSYVSCSRRNSWLTCLMPRHRSYMADCCMRSLKEVRIGGGGGGKETQNYFQPPFRISSITFYLFQSLCNAIFSTS